MIAPCVAILSDRVPAKYRGSMSAFYGAGQIVSQSMGTIIGSAFIDAQDRLHDRHHLLVPVRHRHRAPRARTVAATADAERFDIRQIAIAVPPADQGRARDFYLALVGRLMLIFGYNV